MPVNKKYLKIGVACLAVTALVIGLSVGLTQKNKNNNNAAASSNAAYDTYDIDSAADACYGKSGKSSGGSGKSGKSGGYSMSYEGKSGKSENRALYVPGILEAYGDDTDASTGKRRKLRHQLLGRELEESTKSGKSSGDGSTKSGKSGVSSQCWYEDVCYGYGSSGKSGKSEGGSGKSGKSEGSGSADGYGYGSSGKSGKGSSGCGKSGKSGGGSGAGCPSAPTTCDYGYYTTTEATDANVVSTTIATAECICEEQPWVWDGAMCVRSCDLPGPGSPSATACCAENTGFPDCPINDCGLIPTPSPTEGGTTTVATEKDAPEDTQGDRGGV